jgi:hypothetical protein
MGDGQARVMTPLAFEALYQAEWQELEELVDRVLKRTSKAANDAPRGERIAALYRRACEHLALARARSYPAYLLDRLDRVTADAHQVIYQQRELGAAALWRIVSRDFPRAVRADAAYVWIATALLAVPFAVLGVLVYLRPELILSLVDPATAANFEQMYSRSTGSIGRTREAGSDWYMFGIYIRNNIGIAFQCFASGLAAGLGSIFFLVFNGALFGAVAGYLTERGLGDTFWPFVATHGAFELTGPEPRARGARMCRHRVRRDGDADRCRRRRSVLVFGCLGSERREIRSRRSLLGRRDLVSRAARPPCNLTLSRCACGRARRSKPPISACGFASDPRAPSTRVMASPTFPSWHWRSRRSRSRHGSRRCSCSAPSRGSIARYCSCFLAQRSGSRRRCASCGRHAVKSGAISSY